MTVKKHSLPGPTLVPRPPPQLLSIVCPCFNEAGGLEEFVARIQECLAPSHQKYEIVFVNDGSTDATWAEMHGLALAHGTITVVNLTRNFGKEIALTAGLSHAVGDAIILIDADLQDPPSLIPVFIQKYCEGYDIAYGRRIERRGDSWLKRLTASTFYQLMQHLGPVKLPENVGDFRIMSRRSIDALLQLPETHRFMKGLFAWVGYPAVAVDYIREPRFVGKSKWNYDKLFNLSIEGITSFSTAPLRISTWIGFILAFASFIGGGFYFIRTMIYGDPVQGFPTLFLTVLLLGGTQLLGLGVIGEYLGRIFNETKRRPLFLTESVIWSDAAQMHKPAQSLRSEPNNLLHGQAETPLSGISHAASL